MIATASTVAAGVFLLLLLLLCKACKCKLPLKLLGELLLVIGVLLSLFIVPVACLQLSTNPSNALFYIISVTALAFIVGFSFLYQWYLSCCPTTICDFWQAVIFAMGVAFVAAPLVFVTMAGGVAPLGVGLALLLVYLIFNFASIQIIVNQSANNCN
jgi:hypothetical protein